MKLTHFLSRFFSIRKIVENHKNSYSNIPANIQALLDRRLLHSNNHPLSIIKSRIVQALGKRFTSYDNLSPVVKVEQNFDVLNVPADHVSRHKTDTYYLNESTLLRTHTSAHQRQLLLQGNRNFVVFGDVYRRDQIDRYHYPVFHQMEAVSLLGREGEVSIEETVVDLKRNIENIVHNLFGDCEMRWVNAYFPFTEPSFQLQIFYDNQWVEMLGCGVIHKFVLEKSNKVGERGWAAGLGLERLAMKLFKIPDVRLFWSQDPRFISQFTQGKITQFKQFSKYPLCYKDLSLWIEADYNSNDLFEIIREVGKDMVESVEETMTYVDPKTNKVSKAYRISFRSLQRTLQNKQITIYQNKIRSQIQKRLKTAKLR